MIFTAGMPCASWLFLHTADPGREKSDIHRVLLLYCIWKVKQMDMLKQLNDAVTYIEQNLCGEIRPEEAARIACVSTDSFLRFFSYMTGMTLAAYIRRRRLTLAAYDLQESGKRVLDIAVQYGFSSADAFSRAFYRQHGVTPRDARRCIGSLTLCPPVSFHMTVKGANEMNFRRVEVKETAVYGVSKAFDRQTYPTREALRASMWSEEADFVPGRICTGHWNEPGNHAYDGVWYGIWHDRRYMIAREEADVYKSGLEKQVIPAGTYAAFTTPCGQAAWEAIPALLSEILDAWLPASGYTLRNSDIIEVYHLWTDYVLRRENKYYEIWLPVEKASPAS